MILLDLMLPGIGGLEICKQLRSFTTTPIIMVTARVEEIDRLLGLELGADDYVCKPFRPREVMARIKAILRRTATGGPLGAPELVLEKATYRAVLHGHNLGLTAVEFRLLQILVANPGQIYSREQLMDHIYPDQRIVSDRTIDSHIRNIRKKIEAVAPGEDLVCSVYSVGYKFEPQRLDE
jgi:two-component system response regulator BaeR